MHTFDQTIEVLRGTSTDLFCDRCGSPALVLADVPTGQLLFCPESFAKHAFALVERKIPITLIVGVH